MYDLFDKYLNDTLTNEELIRLEEMLSDKKARKAFEFYIRDQGDVYTALQDIDLQKAYSEILEKINKPKPRVFDLNSQLRRYAALFVGFILMGAAIYFGWFNNDHDVDKNMKPQITLELEDGTIKILNESDSGIITNGSNKVIVKQNQNILSYDVEEDKQEHQKIAFNKLRVPYGKTFQLILSDGTQVMLNAGSILTYPTKFLNGKDRNVYLEGEAYFNVNHDSLQHFTVTTKELNTKVLGTKFNVSSYSDDASTQTVLVAGSVGVYNAQGSDEVSNMVFIKPGQRARIVNDKKISIDNVNINKYIAWTQGKLFFSDDPFNTILKKLERHFNVSIQNEYLELESESLTGTFETENLDQILEAFQAYTKFDYRKQVNTIIITKPD